MDEIPLFRRITNMHVQQLLGMNEDQANRLLKKIRTKYGKTGADPVVLFEFCEVTKLPILGVFTSLWKQKPGQRP